MMEIGFLKCVRALLVWTMTFFCLLGCISTPRPVPSKEVLDAFYKVAEVRNRTESTVKHAKKEFQGNKTALEMVRLKYSNSQAKGNGFIETIQLAISGKQENANFDKQQQELGLAIRELEAIIKDIQTKNGGKVQPQVENEVTVPIGTSWTDIAGGVKDLAEAGLILWKAAKEEEWRRANEVKAELEKRRWKDWDKITAE